MYQMMVDLSNLQFDLESPRLIIEIEDEVEMLEWLLDVGAVQELMMAIGYHSYFTGEPLLVVGDGTGDYIVVDGNQRLAALKLLREPKLCDRQSVFTITARATYKPEKIPCLVFPDRQIIIDHMGYRHICGLHKWSVLAKAQYLAGDSRGRLLSQRGQTEGDISGLARSVGVRKSYVVRLLAALGFYQEIVEAGFYRIEGLDEHTFSFALLVQASDYHYIAGVMGEDGGLKKITEWFYLKKGGIQRVSSSSLKELDDVLGFDLARSRFEEGCSLREAYIIAYRQCD